MQGFGAISLYKNGCVGSEFEQEIADCLQDGDWDSRAQAATVPKKIAIRDQVDKFIESITDGDWQLSYGIVETLASLAPDENIGKRNDRANAYCFQLPGAQLKLLDVKRRYLHFLFFVPIQNVNWRNSSIGHFCVRWQTGTYPNYQNWFHGCAAVPRPDQLEPLPKPLTF